ncbi:MAG: formylglycine-generating enzyme family protein [Pirellulales bacterium]
MAMQRFVALIALVVFANAAPATAEKPAAEAAGYKVYTKWPFDAKEARRRQEETARALDVSVEKVFKIGFEQKLEFVLIPAGEFMMGSPKSELKRSDDETQHLVRITKPFYFQKTEFTQAAYVILRKRGNRFAKNDSRYVDWRHPVEQASWDDAHQNIIADLNQRGVGAFTLPTEAEWEYACRAGTTTPFHLGGTISNDTANYNGYRVEENGETFYHTGGQLPWGNGAGNKTFRQKPTPVGIFPANAFGLRDMHGNVWEWCQDWYGEDYYANSPQDDPTGPKEGNRRVVRGGAWGISAVWDLRSASRKSFPQDRRGSAGGYRLVLRTLTPLPRPAAKQ